MTENPGAIYTVAKGVVVNPVDVDVCVCEPVVGAGTFGGAETDGDDALVRSAAPIAPMLPKTTLMMPTIAITLKRPVRCIGAVPDGGAMYGLVPGE